MSQNLGPRERSGERSSGEDWRADSLARSRHSRLVDHLVEPLEDHDAERAERVCDEICRAALGGFASGLWLLPSAERRRARALGAFVLTLFDLAAKPGLDGDRLAEINRWEFRLEEALDGRPAGQPIFVLLAREEEARPWPRPALDRILVAARQRALAAGRCAGAKGASFRPALAEGLVAALLEEAVSDDAVRLCRDLLAGEGTRAAPRRRLPSGWRAAARYLELASWRLAASGGGYPARLGLTTRLLLLARARFARARFARARFAR